MAKGRQGKVEDSAGAFAYASRITLRAVTGVSFLATNTAVSAAFRSRFSSRVASSTLAAIIKSSATPRKMACVAGQSEGNSTVAADAFSFSRAVCNKVRTDKTLSLNLRISFWLMRFVNQTLSNHLLQANIGTLAVGHLPAVVPVFKLRQIQRQVLCADMVKGADHAALEQ